jgi:hypothetical protein
MALALGMGIPDTHDATNALCDAETAESTRSVWETIERAFRFTMLIGCRKLQTTRGPT